MNAYFKCFPVLLQLGKQVTVDKVLKMVVAYKCAL